MVETFSIMVETALHLLLRLRLMVVKSIGEF